MSCPYHSQRWRSVLQCIINGLRQEGFIKGKHIRNIPKLICVCPDKTSISQYRLPLIPKEDLVSWCKGLKNGCQLKNTSLIESLLQMYSASTDNTHLIKPLTLAYLITKGNVSFLEEPKPQSSQDTQNTTSTEPCEPTSIEKVFFLDIPVISTQYIGTLIGHNGTHLKKICETYEVTSIHLGEVQQQGTCRKRTHIRNSFIYNTPVKVTYTIPVTHEKWSLFETEMHKRVDSVKKKREAHYQVTRDFAKRMAMKRKERLRQYLEKSTPSYDYTDVKVAAAGNYYHGKHKKSKMKIQNKKAKPGILYDSHCLHCLIPFKSDNIECQYHPGYLVDNGITMKVWSCCNKDHDIYSTLQEDHSNNGCAVGRHIWRPRRSKKAYKIGSDSNRDLQ